MSPQLFRGRNVVEARRAALEQLGPEAVVLTTRSVTRNGIGGWFGASDVELAATLPETPHDARPAADPPAHFAPGAYLTGTAAKSVSDVAALRAELKGDLRSLKSMLAKSGDSAELAAEIAQLRELVETIAGTKPGRDRAAADLRSFGIEGPVVQAIARALKGKDYGDAALR